MRLFPQRKLVVELEEDISFSLENLKRNTVVSDSLFDWPEKDFTGQIKDNSVRLITSAFGFGGMCVFKGEFQGCSGNILVRVHFWAKLAQILSLFVPFFILSFVFALSIEEEYQTFVGVTLLWTLFLLMFRKVLFKVVFNLGMNKLKKHLKIIHVTTTVKNQ